MNNNYLKILTIAGLVIVIGGVADAARRHHHARQYARAAAQCELDKDFYANNAGLCDSIEQRAYVRDTRQARQSFPPVQSYEPTITVTNDHQGVSDASSTNTKYIALQTAEDVARSPTVTYGLAGWFASAFDLGRKHPPIMTAEASRPVRTATAPTPHPTRVTTNGGPVYITNSRVTVAQQ